MQSGTDFGNNTKPVDVIIWIGMAFGVGKANWGWLSTGPCPMPRARRRFGVGVRSAPPR